MKVWTTDETGYVAVQGPKGDRGEKGDPGLPGSNGAMGPAGPKGDKGDRGDTGPIGLTGPAGSQGIQGIQGMAGPPVTIGLLATRPLAAAAAGKFYWATDAANKLSFSNGVTWTEYKQA